MGYGNMKWQEIYQQKLTTAEEAIKLIQNGDKVVTGFGCGEPFGLERALVEHYEDYKDIEIISMLTLCVAVKQKVDIRW